MNLNNILTIISLCSLIDGIASNADSSDSCKVLKTHEVQCGSYCYDIVKPLLTYIKSLQSKENQINELLERVSDLEASTEILEVSLKEKENQLKLQSELADLYKNHSNIKEQLVNEKDKQLNELKAQISQQNFKAESLFTTIPELQSQPEKNSNMIQAVVDKSSGNPITVYTLPSKLVESVEVRETVVDAEHIIDKYLGNNCLGKNTEIYMFKIPGMQHFHIPCDSSLAGSPGWTVIQRRLDGSENFNRNWSEYRRGFGELSGEFFIGLDKLHLLTNLQPHELYIHMEDFNNQQRYASYSDFAIGNESESFALKQLGGFKGDALDALSSHRSMKFYTADREPNYCAELYESGWWFNENCYMCNLNGRYRHENQENSDALEWRTWHFRPLKFVQMMIRPKTRLREV